MAALTAHPRRALPPAAQQSRLADDAGAVSCGPPRALPLVWCYTLRQYQVAYGATLAQAAAAGRRRRAARGGRRQAGHALVTGAHQSVAAAPQPAPGRLARLHRDHLPRRSTKTITITVET